MKLAGIYSKQELKYKILIKHRKIRNSMSDDKDTDVQVSSYNGNE